MEGFLLWLAIAAGTLFFVAAVVAWWEHLGRKIAPPEPRSFVLPPPQAVDVDLDLPPAGDMQQRQAALGQALERMTRPGDLEPPAAPAVAAAPPRRWSDTTPMIGPGPAIDRTRERPSERTGEGAGTTAPR